MSSLPEVLEFKFGDDPNFGDGISTRRGKITVWPPGLGTQPTDAELVTFTAEFDALPADHPAKDEKADRVKRSNAAISIPDLQEIVTELVELGG